MATDLAEFVGAALGLYLIFDVPLPAAGLITGHRGVVRDRVPGVRL
jgi:Mn2+/Fe2+ NRAMP family transporter